MARKKETFLTVYCDPGEDFGWAIGRDTKLLAAGTDKMWNVAQDIWYAINNPSDPNIPMRQLHNARVGIEQEELLGPIGRIVSEDWRLYPWVIKAGGLDYDQCRTARVIGGLQFMALTQGIPFVLQPAAIKPAAVAAGAEEFYYKPLRENRHQNDAIQHFVFFTNVELLGLKLVAPEDSP